MGVGVWREVWFVCVALLCSGSLVGEGLGVSGVGDDDDVIFSWVVFCTIKYCIPPCPLFLPFFSSGRGGERDIGFGGLD